MKKILVTCVSVLLAAGALAENTAEQKAAYNIVSSRRLERFGGALIKPGSQQGSVAFVNAQSIVPHEAFTNLTVSLAAQSRLNIRLEKEPEQISLKNVAAKMKSLGADIVVFITSDETSDLMLLNAPEAGWAIVNAAAVVKGAKNKAFKEARVRKQVIRGFYSVAGAMNSQFPGSIMGCVQRPEDLDKLVEDLPMDVYGRALNNLREMGVKPVMVYTYQRACEEGWAPPPKNEIQKAIWKKVHAAPTTPIVITPEKTKQK